MATRIAPLAARDACAASRSYVALPALPNVASPVAGVIVSGRIGPADIAAIRAAGIREVIDLLRGDEAQGFDEAVALHAADIRYVSLPTRGPVDLTRGQVAAFDAMFRAAQRPVLVHCASGNRVGALATLHAAWIDGLDAESAIERGRAWGLQGLEPDVRRALAADGAQAQ